MPWSGQNGNSGGWKGSGGDGPWGPRSKGGGGQQPDIEELFKKSQDRLKRAMPGGSKSGGGFGGPLFYLLLAGVLAAVGFFAFTVKVDPDQVGIVTQFGKYDRTLTEGIHIRLPNPVEQVYLVKPQFAQQISVGGGRDFNRQGGFRGGVSAEDNNASLMLTGDNNIVDVQFSIQWNIKDAKKYLFQVENPAKTVREVAESAMRQVVGKITLNDVLNETFEKNQDEVQNLMQETLDGYDSGINILVVLIGKPDVPKQVVDAVNDVEAAKQDKSRLEQEAKAYINKVVPEARGEASTIVEAAEAYKSRIVAEAEGEAERFKKIYVEYSKAPDITRERLYLEMMERVLSGTDKIILDSNGSSGNNVVPYLPLNEIQRKK